MSVNVDKRVAERGSDAYVEEAWQLKERIKRRDDVLKQRRGFFASAYTRSTAHLLFAGEEREQLIGFAAVRRDGYILFLAVHPDHRGQGFGRRLVAEVANDHSVVTCHARTDNEQAMRFYEHLGFAIERQIDNYYEDGGSAYYLKLGEREGLTDRLSDLMRR